MVKGNLYGGLYWSSSLGTKLGEKSEHRAGEAYVRAATYEVFMTGISLNHGDCMAQRKKALTLTVILNL